MGDDDSNVTMIFDYLEEFDAHESRAWPRVRDGESVGARRAGFAFLAWLSGSLHRHTPPTTPGGPAVVTTVRDPSCPADRSAGATCVFDYGPFNLLTPEAERTGFMLMGHQAIGIGEVFTELAWQRNTSIAQGAPTPIDEGALLTVPVTHPNNPFPTATAIDIGRYRTVDAGARQWDIQNENVRAVLGLRGTIGGWDWEVAAQKARGQAEQTGDKSQGWVRTDFLQTGDQCRPL